MEDFENVDRLDVDLEGYMFDYRDGSYVYYNDYERLLKAYKELKFRMEGLEK